MEKLLDNKSALTKQILVNAPIEEAEPGVDLHRRRLFIPQKGKKKETYRNAQARKNTGSLQETDILKPKEAQEKQPVTLPMLIVTFIRDITAQGAIAQYQSLFPLFTQDPLFIHCHKSDDIILQEEPEKLDKAEKQNLIEEALLDVFILEQYQDITELKGQKERYFYSTLSMTANYAQMLLLKEEKNHCNTIAEMVRFECKTYPRPYQVSALFKHPFSLSQEEIDVALKAMEEAEKYSDIRMLRASNDAMYLYSKHYMSHEMAKGLTEWIEVEQFQNP